MHDVRESGLDSRQRSWCIHCGRWIAGLEISKDHVPSKCLLLQPYPAHLPQVEVCKACNEGFARDEEYLIAFLGSLLTGSTDPERQSGPRAERILRRSAKLRARIERAKTEDQTLCGERRLLWTPETDKVNRVILKNARGHAYFEYGEPMSEPPAYVSVVPLESLTAEQRADFETIDSGRLLPEVGSRMLWRVLSGQDLSDGWVIVQDGIYRYAVAQVGVMLVRTVLLEYLATEVYWSER